MIEAWIEAVACVSAGTAIWHRERYAELRGKQRTLRLAQELLRVCRLLLYIPLLPALGSCAATMALRCAARSAAPRGLTAAGLFVPARRLASKAEMAKSLEADQKALFAALDGIDPSNYAKVLASPELSGAREKVKGSPAWTIARVASAPSPSKKPVTVAVAGAGSAAGSEALFRIAAGLMLGGDQPVTLQLLGATDATVKELNDCAFPLLAGVTAASSPGALKGASYTILLEGDFAALGKALGGGLVAVSGCANAAIVAANAPTASVTAITRITQASAETQLAAKTGMPVRQPPLLPSLACSKERLHGARSPLLYAPSHRNPALHP